MSQLVLQGASALQFYKQMDEEKLRTTHLSEDAELAPTTAAIRYLFECFPFLTEPIHLLVPNASQRRPSLARCHIAPSSVMSGMFTHVGEGILAVSPEVALLGAARSAPLVEVIHNATILCGSYGIAGENDSRRDALPNNVQRTSLSSSAQHGIRPADAQRDALLGDTQRDALLGDAQRDALPGDAQRGALLGDAQRSALPGDVQRGALPVTGDGKVPSTGLFARPPLCTPNSIRAATQTHSGVMGVGAVREAILWVPPNSASPRETALALLLSLPNRMGGYGLPQPMLNQRINVVRNARNAADSSFYKADLCWSEQRIVVEYDSDTFHLTSQSLHHDAAKRAALQALGYRVVTATRKQLNCADESNRLADLLSRMLGRPLRIRCRDFVSRNQTLRKTLGLPHL